MRRPPQTTTRPLLQFRMAVLFPVVALALVLVLPSCDWMPGKPTPGEVWHPAASNQNFDRLYRLNCLACHSDGTTLSAARPMNDPVYLALIGADELKKIIANGVPGTTMPAFDQAHGGPLTTDQIDVLVKGIMGWKNPDAVPDAPMPPYRAALGERAALGDPAAGEKTYGVFCAHCHGPDGTGGPDGGSIVDPAFLGLVSDQSLRTAVIAGREDLGMPNWAHMIEGRIMTDQEIADVVAWMASNRPSKRTLDSGDWSMENPDATDNDTP